MVDRQQVLQTLAAEFQDLRVSPEYELLYANQPEPLSSVFAAIHERLNEHFKFMNVKMNAGRHFNAEDSRQLITLINSVNDMRRDLTRADIELSIRPDYLALLRECKAFLVTSGGSPIPTDMPEVEIERYEPVFGTNEWAPAPAAASERQQLVLVGEGSFAMVHKYVDETYGMTVAVKKAKSRVSERDLARFRKEYELMKRLHFPYIVRAYNFDETRNSFTMEYCDETLGEYIRRVNQTLSWASRKRIALQFLYGLNYLHAEGILHRDISRNNVLVQHFDRGAVLVKLSDFGLHKHPDSDFTAVTTELKGSIIDPALESFKNFAATNDMYAAGVVISYIFSGRLALGSCAGDVEGVVQKATHRDVDLRYATLADLIQDMEKLEPPAPIRPDESPA
ncbi:protein kinase [Microbacterium sp. P02]|uniref:protein kinase domain-containing protein n=1 Tax=Microbacterium sp. P02 TaxID=3366260 RepID=UPI0036709B63